MRNPEALPNEQIDTSDIPAGFLIEFAAWGTSIKKCSSDSQARA